MKEEFIKLTTILLIFAASISANEHPEIFAQIDFERKISVNGKSDIIIAKNGKKVMNTINGHANVILTRIGKDGKIETFCANNESAIQRFHSGESINSLMGKE